VPVLWGGAEVVDASTPSRMPRSFSPFSIGVFLTLELPSSVPSCSLKSKFAKPRFVQTFDLNFVGFDIPMAVSLTMAVLLAWFRSLKISRRSFISYAGVFVTITALMVLLFWYSPDPQSLSMPARWAELFVGASGILYIVFFIERRLITVGMAEAYAIGTFAAATTDAVRTLILPLPVKVAVVHWGGSGMMDLDFQLGIAMAALFAFVSALDALWRRRFVERLVGHKAASIFWAELHRRTG